MTNFQSIPEAESLITFSANAIGAIQVAIERCDSLFRRLDRQEQDLKSIEERIMETSGHEYRLTQAEQNLREMRELLTATREMVVLLNQAQREQTAKIGRLEAGVIAIVGLIVVAFVQQLWSLVTK